MSQETTNARGREGRLEDFAEAERQRRGSVATPRVVSSEVRFDLPRDQKSEAETARRAQRGISERAHGRRDRACRRERYSTKPPEQPLSPLDLGATQHVIPPAVVFVGPQTVAT